MDDASAAAPPALASVDELLTEILDTIQPLSPLDLTLLDAHGCVLAEDVVADFALPPFDNAACDGYAVRADDVARAADDTPVTLPVVGDVVAGGTGPYTVQAGLCVRITTGAPIPVGADAVVPMDWTDRGVAAVVVRRSAQPGESIRRAGEDAGQGDVVVSAGTHLGATQIGLVAAVGRDRVAARPHPRVVVVSTGNELVPAGAPLPAGKVPDANSALLTAAAREAGGIAFRVGVVPDDPRQLIDTLEDQLIRADVVVTSGGVTVDGHDVVNEAVARLGKVRFGRVAMHPAASLGFGLVGPEQTPFFALPGNPVSAYLAFEIFVRPALRRMLGSEPIHRPTLRAKLAAAIESPKGRRTYARANLSVEHGSYVVTPVGGGGSHLIASLAGSNALVVVPENTAHLDAGAGVTVMLLERRHA